MLCKVNSVQIFGEMLASHVKSCYSNLLYCQLLLTTCESQVTSDILAYKKTVQPHSWFSSPDLVRFGLYYSGPNYSRWSLVRRNLVKRNVSDTVPRALLLLVFSRELPGFLAWFRAHFRVLGILVFVLGMGISVTFTSTQLLCQNYKLLFACRRSTQVLCQY